METLLHYKVHQERGNGTWEGTEISDRFQDCLGPAFYVNSIGFEKDVLKEDTNGAENVFRRLEEGNCKLKRVWQNLYDVEVDKVDSEGYNTFGRRQDKNIWRNNTVITKADAVETRTVLENWEGEEVQATLVNCINNTQMR